MAVRENDKKILKLKKRGNSYISKVHLLASRVSLAMSPIEREGRNYFLLLLARRVVVAIAHYIADRDLLFRYN